MNHILHMEHKPLLLLLILLLGSSHLLLGATAPTRYLMPGTSFGDMVEQEQINRGMHLEDKFVHGRMEIETNDYPGSGANNHHDPKTPARS